MKSHFWLGYFPSAKDLEAYFRESYPEDNDAPISQFAKDQGVQFYDQDFLEFGFSDKNGDLRTKFNRHSYAFSWLDNLIHRAKNLDAAQINTLVFIDTEEIPQPKSVSLAGYKLLYLGDWEYET